MTARCFASYALMRAIGRALRIAERAWPWKSSHCMFVAVSIVYMPRVKKANRSVTHGFKLRLATADCVRQVEAGRGLGLGAGVLGVLIGDGVRWVRGEREWVAGLGEVIETGVAGLIDAGLG